MSTHREWFGVNEWGAIVHRGKQARLVTVAGGNHANANKMHTVA